MPKSKSGKTGRVGEVRCQSCFKRFRPSPGVERATCPACGWEWCISWSGSLAKIRKPVWENWERQISEVSSQ